MMAKTSLSRHWSLKRDIFTLYYAFKDHRTPWYAKLTSVLSVVYLLSPVDFVPDIIPFAGYVDDLLIVPFLISMGNRLLPAEVKRIAETKARAKNRKLTALLILLGIVMVGILVGIFFLAKKLFFDNQVSV